MCDLANAANGFLFLMIATGCIGFFLTICAGVAIADKKSYATILTALDILVIITFLFAGFMGFGTK